MADDKQARLRPHEGTADRPAPSEAAAQRDGHVGPGVRSLDIGTGSPRLSSMPRKNATSSDEKPDADSAPQSTVQIKTRPLIERQLAQIARDCDSGKLDPDAALDAMIDANCEWAARFLSEKHRNELRAYLRELADHPVLRTKMGR